MEKREPKMDNLAKRKAEIERFKVIQNKYEKLFNDAGDAIFILHDGKFADCNQKAEELLGIDKGFILGKSPIDFSPELQPGGVKSKERMFQILKEVEKKSYKHFQWIHNKPDGKEIITEISISKINVENEIDFQVIVRDITERHNSNLKIIEQNNAIAALNEEYVAQNEELQRINEQLSNINTQSKDLIDQLQESEEKFRLLFEKSKDPVLLIGEYKFIECNYAALNLLGLTHFGQIEKIHPSEISPEFQPDGKRSVEKANEMMQIALEKGYNRFEWVHKDVYDKPFYVEVSLTPVPFKGKILIYTVWHNISSIKEKEKVIKQSEQKFKELFNQAADSILVGVGKGEIIDANDSILSLTGYTREELIGQNIGILFEKDELSLKPLRYDLVKRGDTVIKERQIIRKDGSRLFVEMNTKILSDGRMQALIRDITPRKEAERELEKSNYLLLKAESLAGLGRYVYHIKEDYWESSPILNKIFGIEDLYKKDLKSWLKIVHPDFRDDVQDYLINQVIKNKQPFNKVYKIIRQSDKQELWVSGLGELEYNPDGTPSLMLGTIQDINTRITAELALKESEEKYKNIFYNSPLGIMHYNNKGVITDCNQTFVEILGSTKERLLGLNMIKDLPNKKMVECIRHSFKSGESYYEDWYTSFTGNKKSYVRVFFRTILNSKKEKTAGVCLVENITERHKARLLLKENEEKFRRLFESANDSIFLMKNDIFIDCNQKTLEMFGCKREDIIGKPPYLFSPHFQPDGRESKVKALEKINAAIEGGVDTFGWVHKKIDGNLFEAEVSLNTFKLGEEILIQAIVRDVTEKNRMLDSLRISEDKFSKIFDFTPDAILLTDVATGKIFDINEGCTQITGFTKEESLGKSTVELNIWTNIEDRENYIELLKKGSVRNFEVDIRIKSGKILTALISADIININNNPYVLAIMRNISDRKEAEQRLKLSEEKFRNIFNSTSDLIAITKTDGTIININQAVIDNSGLPYEQLLGVNISQIISESYRSETEKRRNILNDGNDIPIIELEAYNKNKDVIPLEVISKLIDYENEKAILIVARNIKERKDLEAKLLSAIIETEEKERQRLASDLHDEVGPLLSSMKMYINMLSTNKEEQKSKYIIEQLNLLAEESIHNIREVSSALNPYLVKRYGLKTAIESFFEKSKSLIGIQFITNIENKRFPINIETVYYRIIKELYNNTIKHSNAHNAKVELNYYNMQLILNYEDDGKGFILEESFTDKKKGMGLQNIVNRIKMIDGKYSFNTSKKKGFNFELTTKCSIIENGEN